MATGNPEIETSNQQTLEDYKSHLQIEVERSKFLPKFKLNNIAVCELKY